MRPGVILGAGQEVERGLRPARVALVHDWLNQNGGAERVLEALHDLYPEAPIFTSFYAPDRLPARYREWDIRTTFLQAFSRFGSRHQALLPFYPAAFRSLDLSEFDLVISNSSGFCHGVRTGPRTVHINYCLTPPRFLWMPDTYLAREEVPRPLRLGLAPLIRALRAWDARSVKPVQAFVAISETVRERIARWYRRDAAVVFPPVDTSAFRPIADVEDYYLLASRLVPYKRVDLAVRAFNRLRLPLVIAGTGRDRAALKSMAGPTIKFEGWVSYDRLKYLLAHCRGFVFPGEEDFGIAPLEAQAAGRPVIAYAAGGALETVIEGETGAFFHEPTPASLADAVRRLEAMSLDPALVRRHAETFDTSVFRRRFTAIVERALSGGLVPARSALGGEVGSGPAPRDLS